MFKLSQLTTEKDRQEEEKICRRRAQERQRKNRIFDTKSRILGLDCVALDEQVEEKRRQKEADQLQDQQYLEFVESERQQELEELKRQEQNRKQIEEDTNLYRKTENRKELTRDFDLNDKDALKKENPARVSDSDPWLSVSGAQKFAGEDLSHAERLRDQKIEQRKWLQFQMDEKKKQLEADKRRDRDIFSALIDSAAREGDMEVMINQKKQLMSRENSEYNQRLARQQNEKKVSLKLAEEKDNLAEIYNCLSSDILTENPETAKSALGRNRKVQYMYRGMSKEEVESYRQAQLKQQEESLRKINDDKRKESNWEALQNGMTRQVDLKMREVDRKKRNEAQDLKEENQRLADMQISEQKIINQDLAKENQPTEEYFQQFNTTSR